MTLHLLYWSTKVIDDIEYICGQRYGAHIGWDGPLCDYIEQPIDSIIEDGNQVPIVRCKTRIVSGDLLLADTYYIHPLSKLKHLNI